MIVLAISFLAVNGVMRVLCDLNTYNQVVFGWVLGIWLACVFAFLVRQPIYTHIKALAADEVDMDWYGKMPLVAIITVVAMVSIPVLCIITELNPSRFVQKAVGNFNTDSNFNHTYYNMSC